jgi:hypothetical protein
VADTQTDNREHGARELVAFRAQRDFVDEIRKIARRDGETLASTIRTLLRHGIELRVSR